MSFMWVTGTQRWSHLLLPWVHWHEAGLDAGQTGLKLELQNRNVGIPRCGLMCYATSLIPPFFFSRKNLNCFLQRESSSVWANQHLVKAAADRDRKQELEDLEPGPWEMGALGLKVGFALIRVQENQ